MQMLRVKIWIFTRSIWFFCDCVHPDWLWYMRHRTKMNWHHYIWAVSFSIETRKQTNHGNVHNWAVTVPNILSKHSASFWFSRDVRLAINSIKTTVQKKLNTSSEIIWKMEFILYCMGTDFATWPLIFFLCLSRNHVLWWQFLLQKYWFCIKRYSSSVF